jgi:hypothetical protein
MLKSTFRPAVYIFVLLATIGLVRAVGQERPPYELFQQKIVNFPGLAAQSMMYEWQITGKKTSFVYMLDGTVNPINLRLLKYNISAKGKAAGPTIILGQMKGLIEDIALVWFDQGGGVKSAAGPGCCLSPTPPMKSLRR